MVVGLPFSVAAGDEVVGTPGAAPAEGLQAELARQFVERFALEAIKASRGCCLLDERQQRIRHFSAHAAQLFHYRQPAETQHVGIRRSRLRAPSQFTAAQPVGGVLHQRGLWRKLSLVQLHARQRIEGVGVP